MSSQEYYKESGEGQSRGYGGGPGAYGGGPGAYGGGPGGGYYGPQQPQQAYAGGGGYGPPGGGPGYGGPGYGGPGGGYNQGGYYGPSGPQYGRPPQQGGTGSGSTNCCLALCAGLAACCCLDAFC